MLSKWTSNAWQSLCNINLLCNGIIGPYIIYYVNKKLSRPITLSTTYVFCRTKVCVRALRRVWRYQSGNQNPYFEEEQTTQWPKEKVQKDKQRSTKHTHKIKDRVTPTPLKTEVNSGAPGG